jgi:PEP-CTERM motif
MTSIRRTSVPVPVAALFCLVLLFGGPLFGATIDVAASANGGVATQSSTYADPSMFGPSFAIDGNTDGYRIGPGHAGTLQHTGFESGAWWQVIFNADYLLSSVTIYNRLDCCSDRINPFSVFLLDGAGNQIETLATGQTIAAGVATWTLAIPNVEAGGLEVRLDGSNYLHMAQVDVEGESVPEPASAVLMLLGVGGVCFGKRRIGRR